MSAERLETKTVIDHTGMNRLLTDPFDVWTMNQVNEANALLASPTGRTLSDKKARLGAERMLVIHAERVELWQNAPLA